MDVKRRIDAERFPENYNDLTNELERRRRSGNFNSVHQESTNFFDDDEEDDKDDTFFFEFSAVGQKKRRRSLIGIFILINFVILALVLPTYMVKSLDSVRQYNTTLTAFKCHREYIENEETDVVKIFYDLEVASHNDKFMAYDVGKRMCTVLINDFKTGDNLSIWHHEGVVYQLKSNDRMLLSYRSLKSKIRAVQTDNASFYWFMLLAIWILMFKSVINAISPGTFTKD